MLRLNQTNRLTFTMDVIGTSATPTAKVLVGNDPALAYLATKSVNNTWETSIDLPEGTAIGSVPFKVEVVINGRLFNPINTMIEIADQQKEEVRIIQPAKTVNVAPEQDTYTQEQEPSIQETISDVVQIPPLKKQKAKLLVSLEDASKKKYIPVIKPVVAVTMKEIANTLPSTKSPSFLSRSSSLSSSSSVKEAVVKETTRVVRTGPPLRLIKGEIIYK